MVWVMRYDFVAALAMHILRISITNLFNLISNIIKCLNIKLNLLKIIIILMGINNKNIMW